MDSVRWNYRFDDIVIDPHSHRVRRGGIDIALEPKAFAVLEVLLDRSGDLISRDQLLDAVWQHRHVTPATLTRIIALLRKALGDDADAPRYIQTVHGLGYRFVGSVTHEQAALPIGAQAGDTDDALTMGIEARTVTAPARAPARPWRRSAVWLALVLVAVVAAAIVAVAPYRREPAAVAGKSIAVLPFDASAEDAELGAAADGLSESVIEALSRTPGLRVTGRESAFALDRGGDVQGAMRNLGVEFALTGELVAAAGDVELRYALWQRGATAPLWLDAQRMPRAQLFRVLLPLSERVRKTLAPASNPPRLLDASVTAQDLYWLGRHYSYMRTPGGLARAVGYFERAAQEDPRFVLAYCGLADSYMLLSEYGSIELDEAAAKARAAVAQAQTLSPDSADVLTSEGLILLDEDRFDEAAAKLARAVELAPRNADALLWYGNALGYAGRVREAEVWHAKAAEVDPLNPVLLTYRGIDAMLAGSEREASDSFARALDLNAEYAEAYWQVALQHQFHGLSAKAIDAYHDALKHHAGTAWTQLYVADAYLRIGDVAGARSAARRAVPLPAADRLELAVALALAEGTPAQALAEIDAAKPAASARLRAKASRARALAALGRRDEAVREYAAVYAQTIDRGDTLYRLWTPDLNMQHFANWLSLLAPDSATRRRGIEAFAQQLDRFEAGGLNLPVLHYQRAVLAALRNDVDAAQRELTQAQDAGWLDAGAFERDLVWSSYAASTWSPQERRLAARAKGQRDLLPVDAEAVGASERAGDRRSSPDKAHSAGGSH